MTHKYILNNMVKKETAPQLTVTAPIANAGALSNMILDIPTKTQNGNAIKNLFSNIEYEVSESAIISVG